MVEISGCSSWRSVDLWFQIYGYVDLKWCLIHKKEMWRLKGKTEGFSWVCIGMVEQSIIILQYYGFVFGFGFVVELGLCF